MPSPRTLINVIDRISAPPYADPRQPPVDGIRVRGGCRYDGKLRCAHDLHYEFSASITCTRVCLY